MLKKPRRLGLAAAALAVATGALACASLASGAGGSAPNRVVVKAVVKGNRMAYVLSDDSVQSGGKLVIKNKTTAPHTLSLVTKNLVPRTNKQISDCNSKGHICKAITRWHKASANGPPKVTAVDVGKKFWDREGDLQHKGDSDFFSPQVPPVKAPISAPPGTTLHFICALHPEMHGTIHVE